MLTESLLRKLWPHGDSKVPGLIAGMAASAPVVFAKYGISSPLVVAHFMAQVSHECGAGTEVVENLSYTAERIPQVWPSRFHSTAAALPYAHNPEKLANNVYGGRMGNTQPGDGYRFRGRGATQCTGREGYAKLATRTGLDLLGNPDLVNDPAHFLECGAADYVICGCLPYAIKDDIMGETHHLNGGYIGIAERKQWLARWKVALAAEHPDLDHSEPAKPNDGALRFGDDNFEVKAAQQRLAELGYKLGPPDGKFGAQTRAAVLAFQADNDLPTTGIVDAATRDALKSAPAKPVAEERTTATVADLREAGSETVQQADVVNTAGKTGVVISGGVAAEKVGLLDKAKEWVGDFGGLQPALDIVKDVAQWVGDNLWIVLVLGGVLAWFYGRKIIAQRLADHQSGANLGR